MFIDTHTHLYSSQFDEDRDEVIQRALDAGVEKLLLPNLDGRSIEGMFALELKYPGVCYPMMGLHPCSVTENWEKELAQLKEWIDKRSFIAIGEIGIDLYWDKTFLKEQEEAFITQINWAKELQIPIVIHARDSFPEIYAILDKHNDDRLKGVFHCFSGDENDVRKILGYGGFSFGIGGVVTYKKSILLESVKHIPLEKLVLETDAPYLAPTPFRGKRNESAYLPYIASKISDIFEISEQEIGRITTQNAQNLFSI
jgi:TatD DNase family protein